MGDENVSHVHDCKKASLLDLPDEIILHICSFLEAQTLIYDLSLVCKRFYLMFKDDSLWKARINRISPYISYPLLKPANPDELFWKLSCVAIEKQTALWKDRYSMENLKIMNSKYGLINTLLLMHAGTTCITSTSTRQLLYYKLPSPEKLPCETDQSEIEDCLQFEHETDAQILDMTTIDNMIYACSSSRNIKSWMLINTGLVQQSTYKIFCDHSALMCMSSCPERALFATGTNNGTIYVFDSRSAYRVWRYRPNTGTVTRLVMNSEYILSSSNKTVSVWDQRAGRTMKSITISGEAYPRCMNMQRDWVCVGDSLGKLHLLDLKNDFNLVKSYSTEHKDIIDVHMTNGCLITAGFPDNTVRISSLTDPPQPIAIVEKHSRSMDSIHSMNYLNDTLVMSINFSDSSNFASYIMVWRPRQIQT